MFGYAHQKRVSGVRRVRDLLFQGLFRLLKKSGVRFHLALEISQKIPAQKRVEKRLWKIAI